MIPESVPSVSADVDAVPPETDTAVVDAYGKVDGLELVATNADALVVTVDVDVDRTRGGATPQLADVGRHVGFSVCPG